MSKNRTISITVHPSTVKGEYLTVEDALLQVLDIVSAAEASENESDGPRKIVWRLTDAHTNSPPFTVTAEAFSKDPEISVALEAGRALSHLQEDVQNLLDGKRPKWLTPAVEKPLFRALKRNLNGVSHTDVKIDGEHAFVVNPAKAQKAVAWLQENTPQQDNFERTEIGTVEGEVIGLTKHYNAPALVVRERLSGERAVCVLSENLANEIGPNHSWMEVWQDQTHRFSGDLFYGKDGVLKRIKAHFIERVEWVDVPLSRLTEVNIVDDGEIQKHIDEFWGEKLG